MMKCMSSCVCADNSLLTFLCSYMSLDHHVELSIPITMSRPFFGGALIKYIGTGLVAFGSPSGGFAYYAGFQDKNQIALNKFAKSMLL